jgi:hypothetical protein
MVAFAKDGSVLIASLVGHAAFPLQDPAPAFAGANVIDLAVWRSMDGGKTFPVSQIIDRSEGTAIFTGGTPLGSGAVGPYYLDKDFLTVDPATGMAYLLWNRAGPSQAIMMSSSRDDGKTWSEPSLLVEGRYGASAAAFNGTVLVTFDDALQSHQYYAMQSTDGGAKWSEPVSLGLLPGPTSTFQPAPVALWAERGELHAAVARAEGQNGERVVLDMSGDGGKTWKKGTNILQIQPSAKRNPALSIDPLTGRGLLTALQGNATSPDTLETWVVPILDGNAGEAFRVSTRATKSSAALEYMGASASSKGGMAVWPEINERGAPELRAAAFEWQS